MMNERLPSRSEFTPSATLAGREDYEVTGGTVEFKGKDLLALSPEDR
ncbi:hypothetical protein IH765_06305, partial [Escherichia coli]|nr:hypothetical protein [Escherichia coli]